MNNDKLKVFNTANELDSLNFVKGDIGDFGFVIPEKYNDTVIYFPQNKTNDTKIHHETVLKFTIGKLFLEEKKEYFNAYKEAMKDSECCYMIESDELIYSCFLTSLNSVTFLNTGDNYDNSGIIFIPEDSNLSETKKFRINEAISFLEKNDKCQISEVVTVPSLDDILNKTKDIKIQSIDEYQKENKKK